MKISIVGSLYHGLFESLLRELAPCIGGNDKVLEMDFSSAEWASPTGLVPLAICLRLLSKAGLDLKVVAYPEDQKVCAFYCRMDFFQYIGADSPCKSQRLSGAGRFIEITELTDAEVSQAQAQALREILSKLPGDADALRNSFIDACGELTSNTRHAYATKIDASVSNRPGALIQAQYYPGSRTVEVCVADCGIGIKRSMEGEHSSAFANDLDAIAAALAFRNRSEETGGAGLGLAALLTYVKKNDGRLLIRSGSGLREQRGRSRSASTGSLPCWDGTIVSMRLNVENQTDLSKIWKRLPKNDS